jgi:Translation initiation factor IF-2, N-terminal region
MTLPAWLIVINSRRIKLGLSKMDFDYTKRGYLLPEGCKDLIDVLNLKTGQEQKLPIALTPVPPVIGELTVAEQMTVREVADALKQKPYKIIADLMSLGVFANVQQLVPFEIIVRVLRQYGFTAKKAA